MSDEIKAYKGFNKDMTCRGFQYEEGKEYECDDIKICEKGFHSCENPMDCFRYYEVANSVYHEVVVSGKIKQKQDEDSKLCSSKIKIGRRLVQARKRGNNGDYGR